MQLLYFGSAITSKRSNPPGNAYASRPTFGPAETSPIDELAVAVDVTPIAEYSMLDAVRQQDAKGSIGIENVFGIGDPHRHLFAVACRERL